MPELELKVSMALPTGMTTMSVPTRVRCLAESQAPMLSTVGEARGTAPSSVLQRRLPPSSNDCSTPLEVPLGLATRSWLVAAVLRPALLPGMASTAVRVGEGSGTVHRLTPEAISNETRELSVAT